MKLPKETVWPIEEHTLAKHELLRRYLGAWFPILTAQGFNRRAVFLDGFAGPGVYEGGEPGSPLIAIRTLVDHSHFDQLSRTEFVFLFVEADPDRFLRLQQELDRFWRDRVGGKPSNVKVESVNEEFAAVATDVITAARGQGRQLAPTLAFIDPFGWSGVPLDLIGELLASDKCEVLFNFMYGHMNRFVGVEQPSVQRHFTELFGTSEAEHRQAAALTGDDRKSFLRNLYEHQLREVGGFRFVRSFEMMDVGRRRTAYFLMFGTRHPKGLQVMKDAMWAIDQVAGVRFSGYAGSQQVMFGETPDFSPLMEALCEHFAGQVVSVDAVEQFVIEDTYYKTAHYKGVLRDLEKQDVIVCESERKRRLTYPPGTKLRFRPPEEDQ